MDLGTLQATLGVDASQLQQAENRMQEFGSTVDGQVNQINRQLKSTGDQMKNVGKGMSMYITAPLVAVGAAFTAAAMKTTSYADEIDKGAMKVGAAVEEYQSLRFGMEQLGVSHSTTERALGRLNQRMGRAVEGNEKYIQALKDVGLGIDDIRDGLMTSDQVFMHTIRRLHEMDDSARQAAMAGELLGTRTARDLLPAIRAGGDELQALTERAHELGIVMGKDSIASGVEFNDMMNEVKKQIGMVTMEFGEALMPVLKDDIIPIIQDSVIPALKRAADWFKELDDTTKRNIVTFGAIVAAIGPIVLTFGFLASNVLPGLVRTGGAAIKMFNALRIAMLKNPVTAIAVGVAALTVALVGLSRRTKEAAGDLSDFNDELSRSGRLQKELDPLLGEIETQMQGLDRLSKRQLESLESDVTRAIQLQEDYSAAVIAELRERDEAQAEHLETYLKHQDEYMRLMDAIMNEEDMAVKRQLANQARSQRRYADAKKAMLDDEAEAALKKYEMYEWEVRELEKHHAEVIKALEGFKEKVIEVDPLSEGLREIRKELTKELNLIETRLELGMIDSIDAVENKTSAFQKAIEDALGMEDVDIGRVVAHDIFQDFFTQMEDAEAQLKRLEIGKTLRNALEDVDIAFQIHEDSIGTINAEINAYESALEDVIRAERKGILTKEQAKQLTELYRNEIQDLTDTLENQQRQLRVEDAWATYDQQMEQARLQMQLTTSVIGEQAAEMQYQETRLTALQQLYTQLGEEGHVSMSSVKALWIEQKNEIDESTEALKRFEERMRTVDMIQRTMAEGLVSGLDTIGEHLATGEADWAAYAGQAISAIQNIINQLLVKAIMNMLAGESAKGLPGLALAAVGIGAIKAIHQKYTSDVPSAADGALAYGETLMRVGDYPGASVNPEVVSPLSDLKTMIDAGGGTPASIEVRIRGDELYGVWEKERSKKQQLD